MTVVTTPEASTISTRKHLWSIAFVTACIAVGCNAITGLNQAYSETMCFPVGSCDGGADDATDAPVDANLNVRCYTNDECPGSSSTSGIACCNGSCVDTTNNDQTCGPSCIACNTGAGFSCTSSKCTGSLGNETPFSPCSSSFGGLSLDYLILQRYCFPSGVSGTLTVQSIGVVDASPQVGLQAVLGVYSDSGGTPNTLLFSASSGANGVVQGVNTFATSGTLDGGSCYWVGGDFHSNTPGTSDINVCTDNSANNSYLYESADPNFFGSLPGTYGAADAGPGSVTNTANINFFVVLTQP
jgi:hypothetical protein